MKLLTMSLTATSFVIIVSATSCFGAAKPTLTPEELFAAEAAAMQYFQTMFGGLGLTPETTPKTIDIFDAIEAGKIERVNEALKNPDCLEAKNEIGQTPLHVAVHLGKTEIAEKLLQAGADIEAINGTGWTVLFVATQAYNKEMIELLKQYKANPRAEIIYPFDQQYCVTPRELLVNLKNFALFARQPVNPGTDEMIAFLEVWEKE
ncbi:ankyrin repeat domain-containing protein [Candidatus Babeliales bacterium]|nr:ankyrin repeat domain-containing protein [Candidatus Babeliales bacterium]